MNASDGLSDRQIASTQYAPGLKMLVNMASQSEVSGLGSQSAQVPTEFGATPEIVNPGSSSAEIAPSTSQAAQQAAMQEVEMLIFTEIELLAELLQKVMQSGGSGSPASGDLNGNQTGDNGSSNSRSDTSPAPVTTPVETGGGTSKPSTPSSNNSSSDRSTTSPTGNSSSKSDGSSSSSKPTSGSTGASNPSNGSSSESSSPSDSASKTNNTPPDASGSTTDKSSSSSNVGSSTNKNGSSDSNSSSNDNTKSGGSDSSSSSPTSPSNNSAVPEYADTGIVRGKTIFRDDFNGAAGTHPDPSVFDTAHIGPDGQTRQRGANIDEDGIVSSNNSELDGNGDLQLFPVKQKTYDPVAKQYVDYTTGSMNTGKGLHFNLKDYPNGIAIEVRAKHPTAPGAKFDALWLMTNNWAADPKKGQKEGDTIEYDAAEGDGADITVHFPTKDANGNSVDHYGGGAHPKDVNFNDGKFHTYTVVIKPNAKTGKGDVEEFVDGKQEFAQDNVFPADQDIHLRSSLEISPKWTHQTYTGDGGMNSSGAGVIDYLDVSELAPGQKVGT